MSKLSGNYVALIYRKHPISIFKNKSKWQASPVTFPVNWTKVVDFAGNSVLGKQMAKKKFLNAVSTFYDCMF